ncbi:MAG: alanyl-tRNA editing protein [bacterium]
MVTERLYYRDSYLTEFNAIVVAGADDGRRVYFNRTAFYPESGGQPHDLGSVNGVRVLGVIDEGDRIAHLLEAPIGEAEARCRIDWARRLDHMQQHTGQHLLSAVLEELFQAHTMGFHMSADYSTIDVSADGFSAAQVRAAEERANAIAFENRPVTISFEDSESALALRKPSERKGILRVVTIAGLDRSACGGTHVRSTGEVGPILIRKVERAHGGTRIEFLCGMRAVRRARADYDALSRIARSLTVPLDDAPALVAARSEALAAAEKNVRKLSAELARARGRELYSAAVPDANGLRRHTERIARGALGDDIRAMAQGFTACSKAVFVAAVEEPPSVLLAVSADSSIHAGNVLKAALTANGGRGGGSAQAAQGSLPSAEALKAVLAALP